MRTLLCHPRLDIPFKKLVSAVPSIDYSNLSPIRQHWANAYGLFRQSIEELDEMILPMWEFDHDFYRMHHDSYDRIIVPHKQAFQFAELPEEISSKMVFLMQTVRPDYFTLDRVGWGANLSFLPISNDPIPDDSYVPGQNNDFVKSKIFFDDWKKAFLKNISKFPQPENTRMGFRRFDILFVCQIPHDETIKYHSDVSVSDALIKVLGEAKQNGWSVLVKGHPVNPGSMQLLREITKQYAADGCNAVFDGEISILEALQFSKVVSLVNSGVGFEAMLMDKPIYSYGRSEYQNVVNFQKSIDIDPSNVVDYSPFLFRFFKECLNTNNPVQFKKKLWDILS